MDMVDMDMDMVEMDMMDVDMDMMDEDNDKYTHKYTYTQIHKWEVLERPIKCYIS